MSLKKTALYDVHLKLGAKIVEFAGYYMPIQYSSIMQEHKRVRTSVGLFDVSHMGEFFIAGDKALDFVQYVTINDASALSINQVQYSAMCYPDGGIVDDLLVYRFDEFYMMVVNAANLTKDWEWLQQHRLPGADMENSSDALSLLALQGPQAEKTLAKLVDVALSDIPYYWLRQGQVDGVDVIISRTGYTGEPGFEICLPNESAEHVWNALLRAGQEFDIEPVGLGARDTLRLEMKYCLYGNDIDKTTNPVEAGLGWITKLNKADFIGKSAIEHVKQQGPSRKLVGFEVQGKAFPRHGYAIWQGERKIGQVTSGTFSPMLQTGIGMGYVSSNAAAVGTPIEIEVRGAKIPAQIVKTPFYKKGN
ncbi:glycine cleavage system aminomethyltransferase GcvT [candidate division KSB1 bacterium]|nr:glycine cleavage system aminomethyltransferase GcvT [candidate division KSB1 bacterium]RQW05742.1 MAG: glycine cleavage system aminomethyltransferase GcvT [candidate division KSB1 bacterium]